MDPALSRCVQQYLFCCCPGGKDVVDVLQKRGLIPQAAGANRHSICFSYP